MSRPTEGFSAMMRVLPTEEHDSAEVGVVAPASTATVPRAPGAYRFALAISRPIVEKVFGL